MSSSRLYPGLTLRNERIPPEDADRQERTAAEILRRLADQPGIVLADEVGMGKTFVALAVAVSTLRSTKKQRQVVVMVPTSVAEKWPIEWAVFAEKCLPQGHGLKASGPVRRGSDFIKLLDDEPHEQANLIFLTHGALHSALLDPFMRLAVLRRAMHRRSQLAPHRAAVARYADKLLSDRRFDQQTASALLDAPPSRWRAEWKRISGREPLTDDPVPRALLQALDSNDVDLEPLRAAIQEIPQKRSVHFERRIKASQQALKAATQSAWRQALRGLDVRLPLLILDEAHHVKNRNKLAGLFANEAEDDLEALRGPLGNMFDRMLFLTATPFQLGHHELLNVLDRFHGVRWKTEREREAFDDQLDVLSNALDSAQVAAMRLERAWGRIDPSLGPTVEALQRFEARSDQPEEIQTALKFGDEARIAISTAEQVLRPWVIRHTKGARHQRRDIHEGKSILDPDTEHTGGLEIAGEATLPFLLAARAQAVASLHGAGGARATRALYAYGLASSFEAYTDTRSNRFDVLDDADTATLSDSAESDQLRWYLDRIAACLPRDDHDGWAAHPKIAPVTDRVKSLWLDGEKAIVFCFYRETGRALRSHISRALQQEIFTRAATELSIDPSAEAEISAELSRISERLLRRDSTGYELLRTKVRELSQCVDTSAQEELAEIVIRFMRTPSFLVRFVDLSKSVGVEQLLAGFERPDGSGVPLSSKVESLALSLAGKVPEERDEFVDALLTIQTGAISTTLEDVDLDLEGSGDRRESLLPNVRLANGGVRVETRRRLMLAFNAPFFPEILVASSVMAEGVDLHQDCRHVIHHDLAWNPSTLEQRTGRVDRLGSKAIKTNKKVVVFEPYLEGTHDEKMFRVVKDRDRWFSVVMGETSALDERSTELRAERVPLPESLAALLSMDLSLTT